MSDGNRDADAEGMWCCGGLRSHAFDCKMRNVAPPGSPTNDLSTLLAELDAKVEGARGLPTHIERIRAYTYLCHDLPDILTALREGIAQLQREKATDAWHTGWQQAVKERDEARRECDQWREKWNATLDREARRNAEIFQLKAANNEMREVLLTLSTADPKLLAEQPEMTAGIARMALQLANHWAAKGSVDAA